MATPGDTIMSMHWIPFVVLGLNPFTQVLDIAQGYELADEGGHPRQSRAEQSISKTTR